MMHLHHAHTPRATAGDAILLTVLFAEIGEEIEFAADPADPHPHGRDLHARALAGEYGAIAPYLAPVETLDQVRARLQAAVQAHLDATARARGYDSILSACSYAASANPYQAEGAAFLAWRGAVWQTCYQVLAEVESGTRPVPTEAELIAGLPALPALP